MIRIKLCATWWSWKTDSEVSRIKIELISDVQVLFLVNLKVFIEVETSAVRLHKLFDVKTWASIVFFDRF